MYYLGRPNFGGFVGGGVGFSNLGTSFGSTQGGSKPPNVQVDLGISNQGSYDSGIRAPGVNGSGAGGGYVEYCPANCDGGCVMDAPSACTTGPNPTETSKSHMIPMCATWEIPQT